MVRSWTLSLVLLAVFLAGNLALARPYNNWDLLPYVGLAHRMQGVEGAELHTLVYEQAREAMPADDYMLLTQADAYRREVAEQPEAFLQQLPFYAVKPAYPAMISALARLGVNPVKASFMISRVGYVAIALVLLWWLAGVGSPVVIALLSGLICALPFVIQLPRGARPDPVSIPVVLVALRLHLDGRLRASRGVLLGSLFIRPDNFLWLIAFAVQAPLTAREEIKKTAIWAGAAIIAIWGIVQVADGYSWSVLFHHTFLERLPYPAAHPGTVAINDLLRIYLWQTHPANLPAFTLLFFSTGAVLLHSRVRSAGWSDAWTQLLLAGLTYMVLHWLIFPDEERFFVPFYMILIVYCVRLVRGRMAWPGSQSDDKMAAATDQ